MNEEIIQKLLRIINIHGVVFVPDALDLSIVNALKKYKKELDIFYDRKADLNKLAEKKFWQERADYIIIDVSQVSDNIMLDSIEYAWEAADKALVFAMPLVYLEPIGKWEGWLYDRKDNLRMLISINPHISNNFPMAWFVWEKDWSWEQLGIVPPWQFII